MYNNFYSDAHNNKIIIFLELCSQLFIFGILSLITIPYMCKVIFALFSSE